MAGDRGGKARHTASLQIILAAAGAGTNFREKSEPRESLSVFHAAVFGEPEASAPGVDIQRRTLRALTPIENGDPLEFVTQMCDVTCVEQRRYKLLASSNDTN